MRTLRTNALWCVFLCVAVGAWGQQATNDSILDRERRHQDPEWLLIEPHLPNAKTATPAALMEEGDILHARRFNEDALEFYEFAIARGGDEAAARNRIGVLNLTMRQMDLARAEFRRVLVVKPKDAAGWNNLGAAEFMSGQYKPALSDYLRAVKLDKRNAVYRVNLGTDYFELKDYESSSAEFSKALKLDAKVFQRDSLGAVQARVLTASDQGRFYFEMARISARQQDDEATLRWLTKASEAGFDVKAQMSGSRELAAYGHDPRVLLILQNARALRGNRVAAGPVEPLPAQE